MTALMYHDIVGADAAGDDDTSGFPGRDAALYKITATQFDAHLDAIVHRLTPHTAAGVVFTFDDGGIGAMRAADALEKRGLAGLFFITVNFVGTRGFVTRSDLVELRRRGHRIGSHSCSHPLRMSRCASSQLVHEWTRSRAVLGDILGQDVRLASVPGGDLAPNVARAAARAGYVRLFTSEPTRVQTDAFGLTLTGRFAIQRWTTAETAAALAAGHWLPSARQALLWNAKKLTKRLGGRRYLQLRRLLLRGRHEVTWGDESSAA